MPPITTSSVTGPLGGANRRGRQVQQQLVSPQQAGGFPAVTPVPGQGGVPSQQSFGDFGIGRALDRAEQRKMLKLNLKLREEAKVQSQITAARNVSLMEMRDSEIVLEHEERKLTENLELARANASFISPEMATGLQASQDRIAELYGDSTSYKRRANQAYLDSIEQRSFRPMIQFEDDNDAIASIEAAGGFPVLIDEVTGAMNMDNVRAHTVAITATNFTLGLINNMVQAGIDAEGMAQQVRQVVINGQQKTQQGVMALSGMLGVADLDEDALTTQFNTTTIPAIRRAASEHPTGTPVELMRAVAKITNNPMIDLMLERVDQSLGTEPPEFSTPELDATAPYMRMMAKLIGEVLQGGEKKTITMSVPGVGDVVVKEIKADVINFLPGTLIALQNLRAWFSTGSAMMDSSPAGQVSRARRVTVQNHQTMLEALAVAQENSEGPLSPEQMKLILNVAAKNSDSLQALQAVQNPMYRERAKQLLKLSSGLGTRRLPPGQGVPGVQGPTPPGR